VDIPIAISPTACTLDTHTHTHTHSHMHTHTHTYTHAYTHIHTHTHAHTHNTHTKHTHTHKHTQNTHTQLIGYNAAADVPYWIARNSWSTDWGEDGLIYLEYPANTCGLANEATFVTLTTTNVTAIVSTRV